LVSFFPMQRSTTNAVVGAVVSHAISANKALEKKQLWEQKERQDRLASLQDGLDDWGGDNDLNEFEVHRSVNARRKEEARLKSFQDGNDASWRQDLFYSAQGERVPFVTAQQIFSDPEALQRVMDLRQKRADEKKTARRASKNASAKAGKKQKDKKSKKHKKPKKVSKHQEKRSKKKKKKKPAPSSSSSSSSESPPRACRSRSSDSVHTVSS